MRTMIANSDISEEYEEETVEVEEDLDEVAELDFDKLSFGSADLDDNDEDLTDSDDLHLLQEPEFGDEDDLYDE